MWPCFSLWGDINLRLLKHKRGCLNAWTNERVAGGRGGERKIKNEAGGERAMKIGKGLCYKFVMIKYLTCL